MKRILFILIPIFIFINTCQITARATGTGDIFTLTHKGSNNYFDFCIEAGKSGQVDFVITNNSDETKTNHILVYDSLTAVNGGNIIMTPENFVFDETAGWFSENHLSIILEAGESRSVSIGYTVPDNISEGVYTAIIALYSHSDQTALEEDQLTICLGSNYSSTLAVVFRTEGIKNADFRLGEKPELRIDDGTGQAYLMVPVENRGNAYGFPEIVYSLSNESGKVLKEDSMLLDIFYKKTDSYAAIPIEAALLTKGSYCLEAVVGPKGAEAENEASYTFAIDGETMKDAIKKSLDQDSEKQIGAEWNKDFIVLDKKNLVSGGIGLLGIICLSAILIVVLKGRARG